MRTRERREAPRTGEASVAISQQKLGLEDLGPHGIWASRLTSDKLVSSLEGSRPARSYTARSDCKGWKGLELFTGLLALQSASFWYKYFR